MAESDYYRILQVDPAADPEVIEAAYRRLARKFHPDTNPAPDATARMAALNEAYAVLGDPLERAVYDAHRQIRVHVMQPPAEPPPPPPDPSDVEISERVAQRLEELRRRQQEAAARTRQSVSTPHASRPIYEPDGVPDIVGKILAVIFIVLFLALLAAIGASLGLN